MRDTTNSSGVKLTMRAIRARIVKLLSPVSCDDDKRRQEFILNVILSFSIPLLVFADSLILRNSLRLGSHYHGVPFWEGTLIVAIFIGLFAASKRGYGRIASYILVGIYTCCAFYSGWHWGASLPATLLTVVLVVVISSILLGSRFGFFMSGALILGISLLAFHEVYTLGTLPWKYEAVTSMDILIYSALLLFIAGISWLSNKEIQKSLDRARASEKSLAHERDNLEVTVAERTAELRASQRERIVELSQTAEFGRMSQGFFHDLMTPLTSVALYLETLRNVNVPEIQNSRVYIEKAMRASERMGRFMSHIRRTIESQSRATSPTSTYSTDSKVQMVKDEKVNINDEVHAAIDLLGYKARNAGVIIRVTGTLPLPYNGSSLSFLQIFLNLISNGIDACEKTLGEKMIDINLSTEKTATHSKENVTTTSEQIYISVCDNGSGIADNDIAKIFDDFYTTKRTGKGIGLGLSTVKKIVEEQLGGRISVKSKIGTGTTFSIIFPAQ